MATTHEHRHVYFTLAGLSIALGFLAHCAGEEMAHGFKSLTGNEIPIWLGWFFELSSPLLFYALLNCAFENFLWKSPIFRLCGIVKQPDISGEWQAEFRSSYDDYKKVYPSSAFVKQNWSNVCIKLDNEKSHSISEVADIIMDGSGTSWLIYTYQNNPYPDAVETMHPHTGTCRLAIKKDCIEGEYYTGRGRKTDGTLKLVRAASSKKEDGNE